jgi:hypothetical protein
METIIISGNVTVLCGINQVWEEENGMLFLFSGKK